MLKPSNFGAQTIMGWRFRKSIRLFKGARVNLSKSGVGFSFGIPGTGITWGHYPRARPSGQAAGCGGCLAALVFVGSLGVLGLIVIALVVPRNSPPSGAENPLLVLDKKALAPDIPKPIAPPIVTQPLAVEPRESPIESRGRPLESTKERVEDGPFERDANVTLARPGGAGNTQTAIDERAFDDLVDALSHKESGGFQIFRRLSADGRVGGVVNGTRGRVSRSYSKGSIVTSHGRPAGQ
jgi:hypothetical protein